MLPHAHHVHADAAAIIIINNNNNIAVTTQRFNSVLFRDSFVVHESQDDSDA